MAGNEQKGKGLVWRVTATDEHSNMKGFQGSHLLDLLVVGDSFGPKQQVKTAGRACHSDSSKMLSVEVSSSLLPATELPQSGHKTAAAEAGTEQALTQYF